ncbi:MAG TPA: DUF2795 domain-containing protein [Acidimicrobiales bacterium]|nr:DUF2795 domain-containing protein [Acidimicrobiales bacterium]
MQAAELTSQEEAVLGAIATLETSGETTSLQHIAERAALPVEMTRALLTRLLGELGLVQEVEGDDLGPYYVLSGRAGTDADDAAAGELTAENLAGQLERYVGDHSFPTKTEQVVAHAVNRGAPQPLIHVMNGLPADATYLTVQDLVDAVGEELADSRGG